MHALFIIPYVPSLIRSRSYNLIRHFARLGHTVSLCTLWSSTGEKEDLASLSDTGISIAARRQSRQRSLWNCLLALPTPVPLQAVYSWNPSLAKQSAALLECNAVPAVDVIHVEHLRGARFGLFLKSRYPDTPVVWDSVDCISYLFKQASDQSRSGFGKLITRFDLKRTRRYEGQLPGQFDHVLITSAVDRQALQELIPDQTTAAPLSVLPNGVDWDYFSHDQGLSREPDTLILSGKMSYHANVTMAMYLMNEIMPLVWAKQPHVRLLIVGKDPPANIRAMAEHPAVTVTGTVQDLRPYLQRASIAVAPLLYGAGSQFKVLEAMASGTPVIATPRAVLALEAVPERDLLIAQTPVEFSEKILHLIENPQLRHQIGSAGRRYVENNHQWSKIAERLEGVYDEVLCSGREHRLH
jgi:glycosyltransferase involved in cell wall biosynthesis